jgi:hypothetical protein
MYIQQSKAKTTIGGEYYTAHTSTIYIKMMMANSIATYSIGHGETFSASLAKGDYAIDIVS